jgi:hypothetical protein
MGSRPQTAGQVLAERCRPAGWCGARRQGGAYFGQLAGKFAHCGR